MTIRVEAIVPSSTATAWQPTPDLDVPYALGVGLVSIICAFILVAATSSLTLRIYSWPRGSHRLSSFPPPSWR